MTRIAPRTTPRDLPGGFQSGTANTRRAQFAWGAASTGSWTGSTFDSGQQRLPFRLPVTTTRWRLRLRNRHPVTNASVTGAINFTGVWYGTGGTTANTGAPNGTWAAAPTQAIPAFTMASGGAEVVTDWVTSPALQIPAGTRTLSQIGVAWNKATAGTTILHGAGSMWFTQSAADVSSTSVTSAMAGNVAFDTVLEYEFVGNQRIYLVVGDSISEGTSAILNMNTWHQQLSMRLGVPICTTAVYGSNTSQWQNTSLPLYQKIANAGLNIDGAIIELGINDVDAFNLFPLSTFQSNYTGIVNNLRTLFKIRDVYGLNLAPRNVDVGSASENLRTSYNAWLEGGVPILNDVFDAKSALERAKNGNTLHPEYTDDGLHWVPRGHWRVNQCINLPT